jgi:hypothetical protein
MLTVTQVASGAAAVAVSTTVVLTAALEKLVKVADKVLTQDKTDFQQPEVVQVDHTLAVEAAAANMDTQAVTA